MGSGPVLEGLPGRGDFLGSEAFRGKYGRIWGPGVRVTLGARGLAGAPPPRGVKLQGEARGGPGGRMAAAPAADGRTVVVQGLGPAVDDAALSALFVHCGQVGAPPPSSLPSLVRTQN